MARKRSENTNESFSPPVVAQRLAPQPDYLPSKPKVLGVSELSTYNAILQNEDKEAADKWLTKLWQ